MKALKNLRLLNLSHNPLSDKLGIENESRDIVESMLSYFHLEWPTGNNEFNMLETLILNSCFIDLKVVEILMNRMPNLSEVHLASNGYEIVTFSEGFVKESVKILYLNNNNFSKWSEILKFGKCFPMLEYLVINFKLIY